MTILMSKSGARKDVTAAQEVGMRGTEAEG
jgi:hypothetical protein